jgi:hypothetical protein
MRDTHSHQDLIAATVRKFGVTRSTAIKYIHSARERALQATQRTVDEHLRDAINWLESIINDPTASPKDRLEARKQLTNLLPIKPAVKVEVSVYAGMTPEQLREEAARRGLDVPDPLHEQKLKFLEVGQ